uniref:Zinc finger protein n=1 Tax=Parastrongyloides trichosuri TaxID=131310 RepID=A0A0N4ZI35_PARTI
MEVQRQLSTSTVLPTIFNNDLMTKNEAEDPHTTTSPSASIFNNSNSPNESIKLSLSTPSSPTTTANNISTTSVTSLSDSPSQSQTSSVITNNLRNGSSKLNSLDRKRPYPCNLCVSKFGSKMELEEHQNSHTGEKPFQCDICKSRFNRRSTLWNHKRIHSDNKPFVCTVCNMRFKWKNSLKCHKEMHMRKNESTASMDDLKNVTYATAAKKNYTERMLENGEMTINENGSPNDSINNNNNDNNTKSSCKMLTNLNDENLVNVIELSPLNHPHEPVNGFLNNNHMNNNLLQHYTSNNRFSHGTNPLDLFESHHNIHTMLSPGTNNHLILNSLTNNSPGDFDFSANILQASNSLQSNNFDNCPINPTTSIFTHLENSNNIRNTNNEISQQYSRSDNTIHNAIQTPTSISLTGSNDGRDSLVSSNGDNSNNNNNLSLENTFNDSTRVSQSNNNDLLLQSNLINGYANQIDTSLLYSNTPTSDYLTSTTPMSYTTMPDISLISQANYNASLGSQRLSLSDSLSQHLNPHSICGGNGSGNIHDSDLISFSVSGSHTNGFLSHNGIHMNPLHPFNYPVANVGMGTITLNGNDPGGWHI